MRVSHPGLEVVFGGIRGGHTLDLDSEARKRLFHDVFEKRVYIPEVSTTVEESNTLPEVETPICKGPSR